MSVKHTELPVRIWARDLDGTGSMHPCSKGDPGFVEFVRVDAAQDLVDALEQCQAALALVIDPKAIKSSSVMGAFTQAFEADCKARSALARFNALSAEKDQ